MPDAELKKMIAVREAECADAGANAARICAHRVIATSCTD
jgi:hypothetical protein